MSKARGRPSDGSRDAEPAPVDPLHKATLGYRQHGVGVELEVLEGVFSSAGIDVGTKQLLRRLADERFGRCETVLDLGCGYGPLGLWLAAARPDRRVLAVDRDARAVTATAAGVQRNDLPRVDVAPSLGYDDVGVDRFDLVVSNIPAKIGSAALEHVLLDAAHHLVADGLVAVVVVERLAAQVAEHLLDPAVEVVSTHPTKPYTVFVYGFGAIPERASAGAGFDRGVYRRGRSAFEGGGRRWEAEVSYSVAEFDELGHGTVAALELLPARVDTVVFDGVGQGHLALALRATGHTGDPRLVDRDLLALRTAGANLEGRADLRHRPRLLPEDLIDAELAIVALPEREPVSVTAACLGEALGGWSGAVLLHGRRADVARVLELLPRHGARVAVERTGRHRSHAAVLARRR